MKGRVPFSVRRQRKGSFRALFGLAFVKGLGAPPTGEVLVTHEREVLEASFRHGRRG